MRVAIVVLMFACAVASSLSGCAARARLITCAVVLLVDGKHVIPSTSQFDAIARQLSSEFAQRGLILVPAIDRATHIVTIECISRPDAPRITELIVRDVGPNSFIGYRRPSGIPSDMPSLREAEREHLKALSGFTVP